MSDIAKLESEILKSVAASSDEAALEAIMSAIEEAGYEAGKDVALALDVAASELYADGSYSFKKSGGGKLSADDMIALQEAGGTLELDMNSELVLQGDTGLSAEIKARPQTQGETANAAYFRQWLAALERIVGLKGAASSAEIDARQETWRQA